MLFFQHQVDISLLVSSYSSYVKAFDLQLLTKSPRPKSIMVRRIIFMKILIAFTWRFRKDWNEITIETPMIHINLENTHIHTASFAE